MNPAVLLTIVLLCLTPGSLSAQNSYTGVYRPAYFGIGGFEGDKGVSGNLAFELKSNPKTADNFSFGLRFQLAVTPYAGYTSVSITGDYYFCRPENGLRLFAGAGLGGFNELQSSTSQSNHFFNLNSNANLGFFPRIGVEVGRFRLSAEYDLTGGTDNYAAIGLGFFFGGGRKK